MFQIARYQAAVCLEYVVSFSIVWAYRYGFSLARFPGEMSGGECKIPSWVFKVARCDLTK